MVEHIRGNHQERQQIWCELHTQRKHHDEYVRRMYPSTTFVQLSEISSSSLYAQWIDQGLLKQGFHILASRLREFGSFDLLGLERTWIAIQSSDGFGGFHSPNQGYRYLQQVSLLSLVGKYMNYPIHPRLVALELLRGYIHDTMHYNSFRAYLPLPSIHKNEKQHFFRFQYGINFRKWNGISYSPQDSTDATTIRNIGLLMEAATDCFSQEIVLSLASKSGYIPSDRDLDRYIYLDCTGQISLADLLELQVYITSCSDITASAKAYLQSLCHFWYYLPVRYLNFLTALDPGENYGLHKQIIKAMLTGKLKDLTHCLDALCSCKKSFVTLFKSTHY